MTSKKLILVDGHALAYRSFFALPLESFSARDGEPTNAVYGFTATLLNILQEHAPDYVAVCFDAGLSGRDALYPDYKGHRERMPDEMRAQMDRIRAVVDAFDIPIYTLPGFEADDLMGTLARQATAAGVHTLIVTGDRDLLQLVSDDVHVYLSGHRFSEGKIYDPPAVRARFGGLDPATLRDYKALTGDTSDNIPGVRGIGDKTATQLLTSYASLEAIYAHLDDITSTRFRNALEAGRDAAFLSQHLVTIQTDLPATLNLADCAVRQYDRDKLVALFRELEFRTLIDRLPQRDTPTRQLSLFDPAPADAPARPSPTTHHVVTQAEQLASLAAQLAHAAALTFDTETTSTDAMQADLVGLALTDREGAGWYIPVGHRAGRQLPLAAVLDAIQPLLEDPALPKQAHNAKYDVEVLARYGVQVRNVAFDTMVAEWLTDPGSHNLGLKNLAFVRLGIEMTPIQDLIGSGRSQITMAEVEIERAAAYAAMDVDMTHRLARVLTAELREKGHWNLFEELEMPLLPVLTSMETTGVTLDTAFLAEMSQELGRRLVDLEEEIARMVGYPINVNSSQQLAQALFETLGLPTQGVSRTSTGRYSVAAGVLESLEGAHPIIALILEQRELAKLKSTYVDALPGLVNPDTGRLHTSYNQTGTVTGRVSSSTPNLQNIPVRTPLGRRVRRAFVAPSGSLLLAADYSQVELRVLAHISGDAGLLAAFRRGEDVHTTTAAAIYDVPLDAVTPDQRRFAKAVNFGLVYGMSAYSLSRSANLTLAEAENFVAQYFGRFPKVREYLDGTILQARNTGYVETLLGRRRYFPVFKSTAPGQDQARRRAEREAVNTPIQGSAADIINLAMLNLYRAIWERGLAARMILQVHDELILEVPQAECEVVSALVREVMEGAYPLDAPLKVDLKAGDNWDEMVSL
ncbi:MAG: DNA polymerase I [Anaerolineae bacterium]|nr:DNA polymerase I [Anaerolineae bacterium]